MEINLINDTKCLVCYKTVQNSTLPIYYKNGTRRDFEERSPADSTKVTNSNVQILFLTRKLLEIPLDLYLDSLGDFGKSILCCNTCLVLVEKGKSIFSKIQALQTELEDLQVTLKRQIIQSAQSQIIKSKSSSATSVLRSYVVKECTKYTFTPAPVEEMKIEDVGNEDDDIILISEVKTLQDTQLKILLNREISSAADGELSKKFRSSLSYFQSDISHISLPENQLTEINEDYTQHYFDPDPLAAKEVEAPIPTSSANNMLGNENLLEKDSHSAVALKSLLKTNISERRYKCKICGFRFISFRALATHQQTHKILPGAEKTFECKVCKKIFYSFKNMKRHETQHNNGNYKCDVCGKLFVSSYSLSGHLRTHTGERPYKCDYCLKAFKHPSNLLEHKRIHTGEKPFKCETCGANFTQSSALKTHILIHTREATGESPFSCYVCGKKFSHNKSLKLHIMGHTGNSPYTCEICGAGFQRMHKLKQHTVTHGENPHEGFILS